ncbi:MAG TPA: hypothetical protein VN622_11020 [Clostridia bacterium]|nr:hypothetical protein [Clostridia bacterium]
MARHVHRAVVVSANGDRLKSISEREAYALVESGQATRLTTSRELAKGKRLVIMMKIRRKSCRVVATLTKRDMVNNAEAHEENRRCFSRDKVESWPEIHDTFAVTIVAGRVWIPSETAAAARAAACKPR